MYRARGRARQISSAALSPDGKMVATGHYDGMLRLWHLEQPWPTPWSRSVMTGKRHGRIRRHPLENGKCKLRPVVSWHLCS